MATNAETRPRLNDESSTPGQILHRRRGELDGPRAPRRRYKFLGRRYTYKNEAGEKMTAKAGDEISLDATGAEALADLIEPLAEDRKNRSETKPKDVPGNVGFVLRDLPGAPTVGECSKPLLARAASEHAEQAEGAEADGDAARADELRRVSHWLRSLAGTLDGPRVRLMDKVVPEAVARAWTRPLAGSR